MRGWLFCFILFGCNQLQAQYYFNDLMANIQTHRQYKLLRALKVKKITASVQESANSNPETLLTEEVSTDGRRIIMYTSLQNGKTSRTTTQYEMGKLKKSESNNKGVESTTLYSYNEAGLPTLIQSTTKDTFLSSLTGEAHQYFYKQDGSPDYAYIIRNQSDTVRVNFTTDNQKSVLEETWTRRNKEIEKYYYYYNDKQQLTDIVRFNSKSNKLLPDFVYTYNEAGNVIQMIQVPRTGNNYITWKYIYNEKGLKITENCFNKEKQLLGTVGYSYEF
jgi:hypothetical protein